MASKSLPFIGGSGYFNGSNAFGSKLQSYDVPQSVMTKKDVVNKLGICFGVLFSTAIIGYIMAANLVSGTSSSAIILFPIALVATLVLGLINAFSRVPKPGLIVSYAAFEGLLMGGISSIFAQQYNGIIPTAVFATMSVVLASYLAYTTGLIRPNAKFFSFIFVAMIGYFVFSLINVFIAIFTNTGNGFGLFGTKFGFLISIFAIVLGALMLIGDLAIIDYNVGKSSSIYAWSSAYGIMLDVVWIYFEILRLLAILNDRR
jgi:uncharacterized YccA/Bax inhibitor family protein